MTQGEISKEKVVVEADEEVPIVAMEKPGAKLNKLRHELQNQINQRRSLLWKQRQQEDAENNEDEGKIMHLSLSHIVYVKCTHNIIN